MKQTFTFGRNWMQQILRDHIASIKNRPTRRGAAFKGKSKGGRMARLSIEKRGGQFNKA